MGLSNEERYNKIVWAIGHITELDFGHNTKIKSMVDMLWYEFLGNASDSAYWLFGGSLHDSHIKAETLIAPAFLCQRPKGDGHDPFEPKDDYGKYHKMVRDDNLNIIDLLKNNGDKEESAVMELFLHTEAITYALCRYRDDFLARYKNLNVLVRRLQGECYQEFKRKSVYAYAWTAHQLLDWVLTWKDDDPVNKWWHKDCVHHYIALDNASFDEVFKVLKKHQFQVDKLTVSDRIGITFLFLRPGYAEFDAHLKTAGELFSKKDMQKFTKLYTELKKSFKAEREKPYYRSCEFTDNYIDNNKVKNLYDK